MENAISWPGWDIGEKIGAGGFGSVYEIHRNMFGELEQAALKVISIPRSQSEIDELRLTGYDDAAITARFEDQLKSISQEYSLMRKLSNCPNVVHCDDVRCIPHKDGIGWTICIKMELLTPLMKRLDAINNEAEVLKLGLDLCNTLSLCKQKNILHRDIKPQNIFVSDSGDYKLGDFGIAKILEQTSGGTRIGTVSFMVPEVFNGNPYGHSSDVYSLGLVMYWLLNERRMPFLPPPPAIPSSQMESEALARRFKGEALPPPAHGSRELKRIVLKACAFHPKQRYANAMELLKDLQTLTPSEKTFSTHCVVVKRTEPLATTLAKEQTITAKTELPTEKAPLELQQKPSVLKRWWAAFLGGAIVCLLCLFFLISGSQEDTVPQANSPEDKPQIQHSTTITQKITAPTTAVTEPTTAELSTPEVTEPATTPTATEPSTPKVTEPATTPTATEPSTPKVTEPATTPTATEPSTSEATEPTTELTEPEVIENYSLLVNGRISPYGDSHNAEITISVGEQIRLTIVNDSGFRIDVTWDVSKEGIVSIDGSTVVVGEAAGKVTLSAEHQGEPFKAIIIVR